MTCCSESPTSSCRSSSLLLVLVLLFTFTLPSLAARGGGFMRDGFNNRMEREFSSEASQQVDELGGMTQEMLVLKNQEWELAAVENSDRIPDKALRKHIQQFVSQPTRIKGTGVGVRTANAVGYKAVAKTAQHKKLRAVWKRGSVSDKKVTPRDILQVSYEEAVRRRTGASQVQWELILPPVPGTRDLPSIVFTVPVQMGAVNPEAVVATSKGSVVLYPKGSKDKSVMVDLGTARAIMPMKAGLVDPSWARGRTIFRKGRSVGQV